MVDRGELAGLLERVYCERRQGLYSLALSVTRRPDAAEDAVHEAFARLMRRGETPSGDLEAYLFTAVRNAAIDQRRRHRSGAELDASLFEDAASNPSAQLAADEQQQALQRALNTLPDAQREAVVMRVYGDLSFRQIAEVTSEPLTTIASRYQRALGKLRDVLQREDAVMETAYEDGS